MNDQQTGTNSASLAQIRTITSYFFGRDRIKVETSLVCKLKYRSSNKLHAKSQSVATRHPTTDNISFKESIRQFSIDPAWCQLGLYLCQHTPKSQQLPNEHLNEKADGDLKYNFNQRLVLASVIQTIILPAESAKDSAAHP